MDQYTYIERTFDRRAAGGWSPSDFTRGAIIAAFFTTHPLPTCGNFEMDWSHWNAMNIEDRAKFVTACEAFETKYEKLLERACAHTENDMEHAGRDYHFTSAGHGSGFWDGDWKACGDLLTRATKATPLPELYAELDCSHYHETGEGCRECEGCEAGPTFHL